MCTHRQPTNKLVSNNSPTSPCSVVTPSSRTKLADPFFCTTFWCEQTDSAETNKTLGSSKINTNKVSSWAQSSFHCLIIWRPCTVSSEQLTFLQRNLQFVSLIYDELSWSCEGASSGLSGHLQIQNLSAWTPSPSSLFLPPPLLSPSALQVKTNVITDPCRRASAGDRSWARHTGILNWLH